MRRGTVQQAGGAAGGQRRGRAVVNCRVLFVEPVRRQGGCRRCRRTQSTAAGPEEAVGDGNHGSVRLLDGGERFGWVRWCQETRSRCRALCHGYTLSGQLCEMQA
jgi:hypothetical protein